MPITTEVQERLRAELETRFPVAGKKSEPAWSVFVLQNPAAPLVAISRDPRAGDRVAPVFFITARDEKALLAFAESLYGITNGRVKLWHSRKDSTAGSITYVVVPALFHVDPDVRQFVSVLSGFLEEFSDKHEAAWICEECVVFITHHGKTFRAIGEADSFRVVQS
jgi:hypothetical protein